MHVRASANKNRVCEKKSKCCHRIIGLLSYIPKLFFR